MTAHSLLLELQLDMGMRIIIVLFEASGSGSTTSHKTTPFTRANLRWLLIFTIDCIMSSELRYIVALPRDHGETGAN